MFISAIDCNSGKKRLKKTAMAYVWVSLAAVVVNNVYGLFSHGVGSAAMSWMFLYPLIGGTGVYFLIYLLVPQVGCCMGYRLFTNIYNSGIATLTVGSFLKGILDIAGTASQYVPLFFIIGLILAIMGIAVLLYIIFKCKYSGHWS